MTKKANRKREVRELSELEKEFIKELYKNGLNSYKIAEKYNLKYEIIAEVLFRERWDFMKTDEYQKYLEKLAGLL